jgi:Sec-independent protein translocase protein TatA
MVRASRRYIRYNRSSIRDDEPEPEPEPELTPAEREKQAYKELKEAQERFQKVAWANRNKLSGKQELVRSGKALLKGTGKSIDAFFDANKTISDSVEREIYQHSLEKQINDAAIDRLLAEKRGTSKKKTTRPELYVKYKINGRTEMIPLKDLPRPPTTRRRRS